MQTKEYPRTRCITNKTISGHDIRSNLHKKLTAKLRERLKRRIQLGPYYFYKVYHKARNQFNDNVKYLISEHGYSMEEFCRILNDNGVMIKRQNFYPSETRRGHLSMLVVCTMGVIFDLPTHLMLVDNLPEIWERDYKPLRQSEVA